MANDLPLKASGSSPDEGFAESPVQERIRELEPINQAARVLNSSLDLDRVLVTVLEEVDRWMGEDGQGGALWLVDPATGGLVRLEATGPGRGIVQGWRLGPGEGLAWSVADQGRSLIVADASADHRYSDRLAQGSALLDRLENEIFLLEALAGEKIRRF